MKDLFERSLVDHEITSKLTGTADQLNGQLMGANVSFVILCIINVAICRLAMELGEQRDIPLKEARLAVNGDDGLMKTNRLALQIWEELSRAVGLEASVGKTYEHTQYLNINSRGFWRTDDLLPIECTDYETGERFYKRTPFRPIKYVNLGLMFGMKRSDVSSIADVVSTDGGETVGSNARELLSECPDDLKVIVLKRFINRNWELLNSLRLPWYIPEALGGIGLPALIKEQEDLDETVTFIDGLGPSREDLRIATWLIRYSPKQPIRNTIAPSWKIHQLVDALMPTTPLEKLDEKEEQDYSLFYNKLAVATLFTRPPWDRDEDPIEAFYDEAPGAISKRAVRFNEKLWKPEPSKLCPPLKWHTILGYVPPTLGHIVALGKNFYASSRRLGDKSPHGLPQFNSVDSLEIVLSKMPHYKAPGLKHDIMHEKDFGLSILSEH